MCTLLDDKISNEDKFISEDTMEIALHFIC